MRYGDGDWVMHDGSGWWMGLVWLIVLIGLVALAVWVVITVTRGQHAVGGGAGRAHPGDPEQILAERLARGDIEPDEYRVRLQALREAHRL